MTVTHRDKDGKVVWTKHWGPERLVEIYREPETSLGLSIVGGKVDLVNTDSSNNSNVSGVFIKNVTPNTPAGRTRELKTGDRIIEVDGIDLRNSTYEKAVEVIQASGNPVCLLVQSLVHMEDVDQSRSRVEFVKQYSEKKSEPTQRSSMRKSSMKKSIRKKAPSPPGESQIIREITEEEPREPAKPVPTRKYSSDESSEEEDARELEGNVYTKAGVEISRKSAGNVKRTKAEIEADPEEEDDFGYTNSKVQKKYHNLGPTVVMVKLEKNRRGLGISIAGHKDRNKMAVFICGLNPKGAAFQNGGLKIGDEILEVNGVVLVARCHLNASALIKGIPGPVFKIIVFRKAGRDDLSVRPITHFPPSLDDEATFSQYKGVRIVSIKKGHYGLGIMIIEGKHAEVGQGIFVSDIQEGSAAEIAGLQVGDMILAVNMDCLLGSTYDEATNLLKNTEGVVNLTVCNPNQSKVAQEEEARQKAIKEGKDPTKIEIPKEPEKPKEPEGSKDPKDCAIAIGKDTTIEFPKDKDKPIGFTVIGGNDSPVNGVFVLDVYPDGAAGKDGRLQPGDRVVEINKESMKSIEQERAYQAVLKIVNGPIHMIVHRDPKAVEEFDVDLQKKSGKGSGLCLIGYKSGKGAYVSEVVPGGCAAESGKIVRGDRIIAVGGQDIREIPVEEIAVHVKISNPVQLKLARYKVK
ncbi:inactivation-no-after-potential D protein isoform X1 [Leptopilina boulardi]|uniref:inactivation-no-after-potential D protein isoform X1 n=2 Tax=Leptopilina boulardi TaxID=63433 RepID=UPI0021F61E0A|nr:inactivation-no-after-potential D protein isoform X1 [Leptopilina boulardi]XP_051165180.1 inactivation-no-after-potential D protein isoform X1 [Leptopilina boulardi]